MSIEIRQCDFPMCISWKWKVVSMYKLYSKNSQNHHFWCSHAAMIVDAFMCNDKNIEPVMTSADAVFNFLPDLLYSWKFKIQFLFSLLIFYSVLSCLHSSECNLYICTCIQVGAVLKDKEFFVTSVSMAPCDL